jgi:hypothetical protein
MKSICNTLATAALCVVPLAVNADEIWNSQQFGEIAYEKDIGSIAVLSMAGGHPGSRAFIYLPGLGGNSTDRGVFTGYWIETAPGDCATDKVSEDGIESNLWGKAEVEFEKPEFPSGFVLRVGSCDGDYADEGWADPS